VGPNGVQSDNLTFDTSLKNKNRTKNNEHNTSDWYKLAHLTTAISNFHLFALPFHNNAPKYNETGNVV
jgi:hypothetical protein